MILFHCKVGHHGTTVKVQYGVFLVMYRMLCNAGSPSISGAVIRKVLVAVYIQFINLLVVVTPRQLLQSYASHIMPCLACWDSVSGFPGL